MNGAAITSSAITVVNALPTGIGCAIGIGLHVSAQVEITVGGSSSPTVLEIPEASRSPVVDGSLRTALARFLPGENVTARLTLTSEIPVARGLKSSSAVSTAIVRAVARASGRHPAHLEVGRCAAEITRQVGVSATGALDDALAGLASGFVLTDNFRGEVLKRSDVAPGLGVALYVPERTHPPSPDLRGAFARERDAGEEAVAAAQNGDWPRAMRLNSTLVERTMGYPYGELRARLDRHGAVACGVSGLGPAVAAVAPTDMLPELLRLFPADSAQRLIVPFTRGPGTDPEVA